jgi:ATP-dependent DNA ligase
LAARVDHGRFVGEEWVFEPKWDGFRFQIIKDGAGVRFYSKSGGRLYGPVAKNGRGLR